MIGRLQTSLTVGGNEYPIKTDYHNILRIIEAFHDEDLEPKEKVYICLKRLYEDIPEDIEGAYTAAVQFIDAGHGDKKPQPRLIDWKQDENLIFPAINKVAGMEVRAASFLHWHTFVGYFMEVGDGIWSTVLSIRQKKARRKKLEKWEQEFFNANKEICQIKGPTNKKSLAESFEALIR